MKKKILALVLTLSMAVGLCACTGNQAGAPSDTGTPNTSDASAATPADPDSGTHAPVAVTVGTASSSGAFYAVSAGISSVLTQNSDFLSLMVQATSGGAENTELVNAGELEFGFATTSHGACSISDSGFTAGSGVKNIAGVMVLQSSLYQMLVRADAGIETFADFKGSGLTVCLGNMVPEHEAVSTAILKAHGVDPDTDINAVYLSQDEACERLGDGDIDAAVIMTGVPAALFTNLTIDNRFQLVDADPDLLAQLTAPGGELDFEVQTVIPAGAYNNDKDINTICSRTLIFCQPGLEDAIVYEFCKQVYEHFDEVRQSTAALDPVDRDTIGQTVIPLHPGAEAYYKEIGIID